MKPFQRKYLSWKNKYPVVGPQPGALKIMDVVC